MPYPRTSDPPPNALRAWRASHRLSPIEVAAALRVSVPTYRRIERGAVAVDADRAQAIAALTAGCVTRADLDAVRLANLAARRRRSAAD